MALDEGVNTNPPPRAAWGPPSQESSQGMEALRQLKGRIFSYSQLLHHQYHCFMTKGMYVFSSLSLAGRGLEFCSPIPDRVRCICFASSCQRKVCYYIYNPEWGWFKAIQKCLVTGSFSMFLAFFGKQFFCWNFDFLKKINISKIKL